MKNQSILRSLASGAIGACVLSLVHESARRVIPHAPRVDVLGKRAIVRPMRAMGLEPPSGRPLYWGSLVGDITINGFIYSLIGLGDRRWRWARGAGIGAGLGALSLLGARVFRLGRQPGQKSPITELLTIAWFTIGGLAAAGASELLEK